MLPSFENSWDAGGSHQAQPRGRQVPSGNGCIDMTAGRLLIGETPPAALCQAIIFLGGGAPFHSLEVLMVGVQVQGDILPLNKISEMPLVPLRNRKLGWEQPGHRDQVPIRYPHWGIMTHILNVEAWRGTLLSSFSELCSESLPISGLDAVSKSLAIRQLAGRPRG